MRLVKVTDHLGYTYRHTFWKKGACHSVPENRRYPELCSDGVIHAYRSVPQALFCYPAHISDNYLVQLWEAEGEVVIDDGTKVGVYKLTITDKIDHPDWFVDAKTYNRVCALTAATVLRETTKLSEASKNEKYVESALSVALHLEHYALTGQKNGSLREIPYHTLYPGTYRGVASGLIAIYREACLLTSNPSRSMPPLGFAEGVTEIYEFNNEKLRDLTRIVDESVKIVQAREV